MIGREYGANWDWGEGEGPSAGGGERSSQVKVGIGLVGVKLSTGPSRGGEKGEVGVQKGLRGDWGALEFVGLGDSALDVRLSRGKVAGGETAPSTWCKDAGNTNLVLQTSVLQ